MTSAPAIKPYVVFVPQVGVGGFRPFWFDTLVFAQMFAEETSGVVFIQQPQPSKG